MADPGFRVKTSERQLRKLLREFAKQIPFATSKALSSTAANMIPDMRKSLTSSLKVKAKGLPRAAFDQRRSIVRAEKKDWPHSKAILGIPNDSKFRGGFLRDHVTGAERKSVRGGRIAIPTRASKRNAKGRFSKTKSPGGLLSSGKGFLFEDNSGGESIAVKKGKRAKDQRRTLFTLRKKVKIEKVWNFRDDAQASFSRRYLPTFNKAFLNAVRSAKRRNK
jgi:hypothetical protein